MNYKESKSVEIPQEVPQEVPLEINQEINQEKSIIVENSILELIKSKYF